MESQSQNPEFRNNPENFKENNFKFKWTIVLNGKQISEGILIQQSEADLLRKVSLKILNSGITLKILK